MKKLRSKGTRKTRQTLGKVKKLDEEVFVKNLTEDAIASNSRQWQRQAD